MLLAWLGWGTLGGVGAHLGPPWLLGGETLPGGLGGLGGGPSPLPWLPLGLWPALGMARTWGRALALKGAGL